MDSTFALCAHTISITSKKKESDMKNLKLSAALCSLFLSAVAEDYNGSSASENVTDKSIDVFDAFYLGAGGGCGFMQYDSYRLGTGGFLVAAPGSYLQLDQQKLSRPFGSVVAGVGKTFYGWLYLGFECLVDFFRAKTDSNRVNGVQIVNAGHDSDGGYTVYNGGVQPSLGVRLGYVDKDCGAMVYVKPSIVFARDVILWHDSRRTFTGPDGKLNGKPKREVVAIAFGVQKNVYEQVSVRLEGEFFLERSWEVDSIAVHGGNDTGWRTRAKSKSYNVRILATYEF
jgi:hypothetical protein